MSNVNKCEYERPNHAGALLQVLREQDDFCDVTIKVGHQEMRAHRVILAGTTNYFHRMFKAGFTECKKDVVTIENVNEENMQSIIEFSYTGKIAITKENAANLLKDADFLELHDVKNKCAEYLESNVDVNNVCEVALLAELLPECSSLLKRSSTFIRENLRDVSQTDAFTDLDVEILRAVLSEDTSRLSLELVLEVIIDWASDDVEKKKDRLLELYHYVDLSNLKAQFLTDYLLKDRFKNSLGSKHSEFVIEILSVLNKPKAGHFLDKTKFYIFVCGRPGNYFAAITEYYDFTTEQWNRAPIDLNKMNIYFQIVAYKDKVYALSENKIIIVCDFDGMSPTYIEIEIPFVASSSSDLTILNDCLYVMEGSNNNIWRFSLKTQRWQSVSPMRNADRCCEFFVLQGHIYAVGYHAVGKIEEYNPQTNEWTHICDGKINVTYPTAVGLNDKIYLCGGWDGRHVVAFVRTYDIKEKGWTDVASMNIARYHHTAVAHEGKIWAIGGVGKNGVKLSSVEVYDPSTNLWSYGKPTTRPIVFAKASILSTNR